MWGILANRGTVALLSSQYLRLHLTHGRTENRNPETFQAPLLPIEKKSVDNRAAVLYRVESQVANP